MQYALSAIVLVSAFLFMLFHATRGLDLTDEGMYLATPLRFALGDSPYKDEDMSIVSQYNVLTSYIFRIYPDVSLFEFRAIGLAFYMTGIIALFLIFSAYAPPVFVSFCAAAAFIIANFYRQFSPSYDLLSSTFSICALSAWLYSHRGNARYKAAFAALGGLLYSLAVLTYPSLGLLVFVPIGAALYHRNRASFQALGFFIIGSSLTALFFAAYFLMRPDFPIIDMFTTRLSSIASSRLTVFDDNFFVILRAYASLLPLAAIMAGTLYFCVSFLQSRRPGDSFFPEAAVLFALFGVFLVWSGAFGNSLLNGNIQLRFLVHLFQNPNHIEKTLLSTRTVALVFSVAAVFLFLIIKRRSGFFKPEYSLETMLYTSAAWGVIMAVSYGLSSNRTIKAPSHALPALLIPVFAGIYCVLNEDSKRKVANRGLYAISAVMLSFLVSGAASNFTEIKRDAAFWKLDRSFSVPKLQFIRSTEKKVASTEQLLGYMEGRVRKGDFLLAYNNLPMIYYLTHTRPKFAVAWAMEQHAGSSYQEKWVRILSAGENLPEYCIRMLAVPKNRDEGDFDWSLGTTFSSRDRLDSFVSDNYYLERLIYPFEVLRRGPGPKYRVFEAMNPVFADDLSWLRGNESPSLGRFGDSSSPMMIFKNKGGFTISPAADGGKAAMRVQPPQSGPDKRILEFGYQSAEILPAFPALKGREVIFMAEARLSREIPDPAEAPQLFIDDNKDNPQRNGAAIYAGSWQKYAVSMKPRDDTPGLTFGISWQPKTETPSLDIRDIKIIIL